MTTQTTSTSSEGEEVIAHSPDSALVQSTLPQGLPEKTLGWYLLYWAAKYLRQPDGPDAGRPFMFTPEQTRLVLWWYAVDENGRFLFNSGVIRRMKGWGLSRQRPVCCRTVRA